MPGEQNGCLVVSLRIEEGSALTILAANKFSQPAYSITPRCWVSLCQHSFELLLGAGALKRLRIVISLLHWF